MLEMTSTTKVVWYSSMVQSKIATQNTGNHTGQYYYWTRNDVSVKMR